MAFQYRRDIDGLRGLAVVLVVLFHAFPKLVARGFVGVDIFFVISGYLITGLLLQDYERGRYSLVNFYFRRFRRIFPALLAILIVTPWIGRQVLLVDEFRSFGEQLTATCLFVVNFLFWNQSGYFDAAAESKPLLHLWSLAVEEQFYVLWPILLWLGLKAKRLHALTWALVIGSFLLNVWRVSDHQSEAFYLLPERMWELLLGSLLALREAKGIARSRLFAPLSVLFLLSAIVVRGGTGQYPGAWALLPTLAAYFFIAAGPTAWCNWIFSHKVWVYLGLISYPLYLWHWPLLVFYNLQSGDHATVLGHVLVVLTAVGLADLTYRFIENPIRSGRWIPGQPTPATKFAYLGGVAVLLLALAGFGSFIQNEHWLTTSQFETRVFDSYRNYIPSWRIGKCFLRETFDRPKDFAAECSGDGAVFLIGDSQAAQLYPGLQAFLEPLGYKVSQFTASACPPVRKYPVGGHPHCEEVNDFRFQRIREAHARVVVLGADWSYDIKNPDFCAAIPRSLKELSEIGVKHILVVGQVPMRKIPPFKIWAREFLLRHQPVPEYTAVGLDRNKLELGAQISQCFGDTKVEFIDTENFWCKDGECRVRIGDNLSTDLVGFDAGHITDRASIFFVKQALGARLTEDLKR